MPDASPDSEACVKLCASPLNMLADAPYCVAAAPLSVDAMSWASFLKLSGSLSESPLSFCSASAERDTDTVLSELALPSQSVAPAAWVDDGVEQFRT